MNACSPEGLASNREHFAGARSPWRYAIPAAPHADPETTRRSRHLPESRQHSSGVRRTRHGHSRVHGARTHAEIESMQCLRETRQALLSAAINRDRSRRSHTLESTTLPGAKRIRTYQRPNAQRVRSRWPLAYRVSEGFLLACMTRGIGAISLHPHAGRGKRGNAGSLP